MFYALYKKEKRININKALSDFVERLELSFKKNKWNTISYNNAIYNGIIKKLNSSGTFKKFKLDASSISFIL